MHSTRSDASLWERAPGKLLSRSFRARLVEFFDTRLPANCDSLNGASDVEGEDLAQEVYLRLLTQQRGVHRIANHVLREHESRLEIEHAHIAERYEEVRHGCLGASHDPERLLLTTEAVEQAMAIVMRLPVRLREVWVLKYLEELTHPEVAEQLGIAEKKAREYLYRARGYLSKHLS